MAGVEHPEELEEGAVDSLVNLLRQVGSLSADLVTASSCRLPLHLSPSRQRLTTGGRTTTVLWLIK